MKISTKKRNISIFILINIILIQLVISYDVLAILPPDNYGSGLPFLSNESEIQLTSVGVTYEINNKDNADVIAVYKFINSLNRTIEERFSLCFIYGVPEDLFIDINGQQINHTSDGWWAYFSLEFEENETKIIEAKYSEKGYPKEYDTVYKFEFQLYNVGNFTFDANFSFKINKDLSYSGLEDFEKHAFGNYNIATKSFVNWSPNENESFKLYIHNYYQLALILAFYSIIIAIIVIILLVIFKNKK